jgi:YD repeat-containing protein
MRYGWMGGPARRVVALSLFAIMMCAQTQAQVVRAPALGGARAGGGDRGASATVPLPFAPERTGVPIPVHISFVGGGRVHNAGLGWRMPLSYVHLRDDDVGQLPQADGQRPKRVIVSIGGAPVDLVAVDAAGTRWTPRDISQVGELVKMSEEQWIFHQGATKYIFERASEHAHEPNRFWLVEVRGEGANSVVKLAYEHEIRDSLPGVNVEDYYAITDRSLGYETRLSSISYNFLPGSESIGCAKHRVDFLYEQALQNGGAANIVAPSPSATHAEVTTMRLDKIEFKTSDSVDSCGGTMKREHQIELSYSPAPDTGMPRLVEVKARGRTQSGDSAISVAKYRYGPAGGWIEFESPGEEALQHTSLPQGLTPSFSTTEVEVLDGGAMADAGTPALACENTQRQDLFESLQRDQGTDSQGLQRLGARVISSPTCIELPALTVTRTWSTFTDLTGDGRPDWVYRPTGTSRLKIAVNQSTQTAVHFAPPVDLFQAGNFEVDSVNNGTLPLHLTTTSDIWETRRAAAMTATWVKLLDMNGDGRLDIVDARHPAQNERKRWVVYLNTPPNLPAHGHHGEIPGEYGPSATAPMFWMRTNVDVTNAQETLFANFQIGGQPAALEASNGWPGGADRLPLETIVSGGHVRASEGFVYDPEDCILPFLGAAEDECAWYSVGTYVGPLGSDSVTLHRIQDANGDGFPDLLFATWGAESDGDDESFVHGRRPYDYRVSFPGEFCIVGCSQSTESPWNVYWLRDEGAFPQDGHYHGRTRHWGFNADEVDGPIFALYNVTGAALGAHATHVSAFADALVLLGDLSWMGCNGLDESYTDSESNAELQMGTADRSAFAGCAIRDVTGDGLLDVILRPGHPNGDEKLRSPVLIGNGAMLGGQVLAEIPVSTKWISHAKAPRCAGPGRVHPLYLNDPDAEPNENTGLFVRNAFNLGDLNGDGLVDSVGVNAARMGTGGADVDSAGAFTFELFASDGVPNEDTLCEGGVDSTLLMVDVNGDGALDRATIKNGELHVGQLQRSIGDPDIGLLTQQRLVEVTDGYGAGIKYTYANAKANNATRHEVPFAEIVVSKTEPVGEPVNDPDLPEQEPTYFAYGDIQMHYSELAGRFVPTGYAKQATLRGRTVGDKIRGMGTVSYARTLNSTFGVEFISEVQRDLLIGAQDKERTFEGEFDLADGAWDLLLEPANNEDPLRSETRYTFEASVALHADDESMEQPADRSIRDRCRLAFWPYGGTQPLEGAIPSDGLGFPLDINSGTRNCAGRVGRKLTEVEGESGLFMSDGSADDRTIKSVLTYETFDARGRALRTRDHRDVADAADDVCTIVSYAEPTGDSIYAAALPGYNTTIAGDRLLGRLNQVLDAVQDVQVTDCESRVLSKIVTEYDDIGPHGYTKGWPVRTRTLFEKADGTFTADDEGVISPTTVYNQYGQPTSTSSNSAEGLSELAAMPSTQTTNVALTYDPFSLVVLVKEATANDDPTVLRISHMVDPISLQVRAIERQDGDVTHVHYDGYDRPTKVTVSHPNFNGGAEYIVSATEYVGDNASTHTTRKIRRKTFTAWKLASAYSAYATSPEVNERWVDTFMDGFGRIKYSEAFLGTSTPYGGKRLRSGTIKYDSLGRVVFLGKKPFVPSSFGLELLEYGTTFRYPDYSTDPVCQWNNTGYLPVPSQPYTWRLAQEESVNGVEGYRTPAIPHTGTRGFGSALSPIECSLTSFEPSGLKQIKMHATGFNALRAYKPLVATTEIYNAAGELVERRSWDGESQDKPAEQTRYTYDRFGRMETQSQFREPAALPGGQPGGGARTTLKYDGLGRVTRREVPDASAVIFRYDSLGRLLVTEQQDDAGEVQRFARRFDSFGRIAESGRLLEDMTDFDVTDNTHTQTAFRTDAEYGAGRIATISRSGAPVWEIEYDYLGRVSKTTSSIGAQMVQEEPIYDGFDRVGGYITRADDNAFVSEYTRFQYDSSGRVRKIEHGLGPAYELVSEVTSIDVWGNPSAITRGNGSSETYVYEVNNGRHPLPLARVTTEMEGAAGLRDQRTISYSRDLWERPLYVSTRLIDRSNGTLTADVTYTKELQYDGLGRINNAKLRQDSALPPTSTSLVMSEAYRYDPLGNRSFVLNELSPNLSMQIVPRASNLKRICRATIGSFPATSTPPVPDDSNCSVNYDVRGRVTDYVQPFTSAAINLEHTEAGEVAAVQHSGLRTEYTYGAHGGIASRAYSSPTIDAQYYVLGNSEERPDASGGALVERHLAGGVSLRGVPGVGNKLYNVAQLGAATSLMNQANTETSFRIYTPLGRRIGYSGAHNSASEGTLHQAPGEDVCGYHGSCSSELYRIGAAIYDPYFGRLMH